MPVYPYECDKCGNTEEVYCSVKEYETRAKPRCCKQDMRRVITASYVQPDIAGYQSMVTGEWISSRVHHRDHLKRHDCIEIGTEKPKPKKYVEPDEKQLKRDLSEAYDQVVGT